MQKKKSGHRPGVTLMELLLVVAVLAIVAPITVPVASSYFAGSKDLAVTHQVVDLVSHTRSMGLMGRQAESAIGFENASSTFYAGGGKSNLPDGFTFGDFKVAGANSTALSVVFGINGNIVCNGVAVDAASVDLKKDGVKVSTVHMTGIGIPVPEMTASVDPANPSGNSGNSTVSQRCRWF